MPELNTYLVAISGIVQGVGFRPFIYNLATKLGHKGYVSNGVDGLKIVFNAEENLAIKFYEQIIRYTPAKAKIVEKTIQKISKQNFETFKIAESETTGQANLTLTPDFAICIECLTEINDPQNRRYKYAFTTCTNCGPRYSIQKKLPYDRQNTSMAVFDMCADCLQEFNDPTNRRFYSQSNSCPQCAIKMAIYDNQNILISDNQSEIIDLICKYLDNQKILAIKGIGGYLLMCDATNNNTVQRLRANKHRPHKPFAVMVANVEDIEKQAYVSEIEKQNLASDTAPILVLAQKEGSNLAKAVNPNLAKIGIMRAYTPLFYLICAQMARPVVATSGNLSGNPIVYSDQNAITDFTEIADIIVVNNREIVVPQDDSVLQFSPKYHQKIILRRSRGFDLDFAGKQAMNSIAFGASLKGAFAIRSNDRTFVSQYLGNLESYETQQSFKKVWHHYNAIFDHTKVKHNIFCDAHPSYFSSILADSIQESSGNSLQKVQHHEAHFLAVLAENQLFETEETVMGVIWDGTGYGSDGHIWGGEFFIFDPKKTDKKIERIAHFSYFDSILGDKMAIEPRISALCLAPEAAQNQAIFKNKFNETEWALYPKIIENNKLKTSAVGRLFDAVASILTLMDIQTFEGQAAILLEQQAQQYFRQVGYGFMDNYLSTNTEALNIDSKQIIDGVIQDMQAKKPIELIAAKFHNTLVMVVSSIAKNQNIKKIAFSGGVFQNALLIDLLIHLLGANFQLYFHKNFSPNDENIALGQLNYSLLN